MSDLASYRRFNLKRGDWATKVRCCVFPI